MLALANMLLMPIVVPLENMFQIIIPSRMYNGKCSICDLKRFVNTKYKTLSIKSGSRKVQKNPNTEFLYLILRSEIAKLYISDFFFQISS